MWKYVDTFIVLFEIPLEIINIIQKTAGLELTRNPEEILVSINHAQWLATIWNQIEICMLILMTQEQWKQGQINKKLP